MMHTFAPGRDVDDATLLLARFDNGSIGTFEASRYGVGCQNRNTFEVNGSKGMLSFTLEDMNHLDFFDATEPVRTLRAAAAWTSRRWTTLMGKTSGSRAMLWVTNIRSLPRWEIF